jgi:hypothetical protein
MLRKWECYVEKIGMLCWIFMNDARKLGERNWRNAKRNRDSWQKLLRKALAQKGLLCQ